MLYSTLSLDKRETFPDFHDPMKREGFYKYLYKCLFPSFFLFSILSILTSYCLIVLISPNYFLLLVVILYREYRPDNPMIIYTSCTSAGLVPNTVCTKSSLNAPIKPQFNAPKTINICTKLSKSFPFICSHLL